MSQITYINSEEEMFNQKRKIEMEKCQERQGTGCVGTVPSGEPQEGVRILSITTGGVNMFQMVKWGAPATLLPGETPGAAINRLTKKYWADIPESRLANLARFREINLEAHDLRLAAALAIAA